MAILNFGPKSIPPKKGVSQGGVTGIFVEMYTRMRRGQNNLYLTVD